MWILMLEAAVAVGLLLFIVWWTLGSAQRRDRDEVDRLSRERAESKTDPRRD